MATRNIAASIAYTGKRLAFLRQNYRLFLAWPIAALVLSVIGWASLFSHLNNKLRDAETAALTQAEALARSYAAHLTRTVEAIDQLALHVRYSQKLMGTELHLEDIEKEKLFPRNSVLNVAIVDRTGLVLTGTNPDLIGLNVSDTPYFQVPKDAAEDFLYIGVPSTILVADRVVIPFSRRLTNSSDEFDGVVVIAVVPDYLTANYDEASFGKNGLLGVVGDKGFVKASRIGDIVQRTPAIVSTPYFKSPTGSALIPGTSFIDKHSRYLGWVDIEKYPLIALVGLDQENALAPYWAMRSTEIFYATYATAALALFTLVAMAFSVRLAWRKHQWDTTQFAYRVATEVGREGFYIVRPVYDPQGGITDFEIIDCNHRGAAMLRQRREEMIGNKVSTLYEAANPDRLMAMLREAMAAGSYDQDLEIPSESPVVPRWVHLTIVRAGDEMALTLRDISETKAHVDELERRSNEDVLTGLPNRHWVQTYLSKAIKHAAEHDAKLALLFIDLDGFKAVNDTAGHAAGDELLRCAASRLKDAVRPHDHVARLGGDEFVVILEQIGHESDAVHVAERIRRAFQESFRLSQGVHRVGTSIGISMFPSHGTDAEALMRHADIAMYAVKTNGKGNYQVYDQKFYDVLRTRLEREAELRHAVESDQFIVYYQPRIDILTGITVSMEALVRWAHPSRGVIEPLEFIPLAEETGLILRLGEMVIEKVCAQLAYWGQREQEVVPVSINVSPRQFNEVDVVKLLSASLARHHVDPKLVEIELTESLMLGDSLDVTQALIAIRRMGIKLLVDDFGTGYSSLSQLHRLDFDILKVDRAFTAQINQSERGKVFFKAIITMAHALGMRVVAEGVESLDQINILVSLKCDEIQGFYISKPLPAAEAQPIMPKWYFPSRV